MDIQSAKQDSNFSYGKNGLTLYCSYEYITRRGLYYYPHWHDNIELLYISQGTITVYLGNTPYVLTPGQLLYLAPNVVHTIYHYDKEPVEYFVYALSNEMLPPSYLSFLYPQNLSELPVVFSQESDGLRPSTKQFKAVVDLYENKQFCYELDISAFLISLVSFVFQAWNQRSALILSPPTVKQSYEKVKSLLDYISTHYADDLSASFAAKLCCSSYSNFTKLFKQMMGTSFTIFLNQYRINESKKLLLTTNNSIREIAFMVGFNDCSYYIKLFRKENGISPSSFRKSMAINCQKTEKS